MPVCSSELLSRQDLRSVFAKSDTEREKIGLEVESGVVDPDSGLAAPYGGRGGIADLFKTIAAEFGGEPHFEGGYLTGIRQGSGAQVTLEHGGAVEYASAPAEDLVTVVEETQAAMTRLAEIARGFGLAILPGANLPFNGIENVPWVPKPRGPLMREYYARLGDSGTGGAPMMALSLSTQVSLDYLSEADLTEKLRMQLAATPVVTAMLVNSPLDDLFQGV